MSKRERLPNRRPALGFDFKHNSLGFHAHLGFLPDGRIGELFLNSERQNSSLDAIASDAAILISLLLQRGAPLNEISHALRRDPLGAPASLIGEIVDKLMRVEANHD